jgi:hypothetical protein
MLQYHIFCGMDCCTDGMFRLERESSACYNRAVIIDFHTHVFPQRLKEDRDRYLKKDPGLAVLYLSPMAKIATADELIDSMDRDGIDISVILNSVSKRTTTLWSR